MIFLYISFDQVTNVHEEIGPQLGNALGATGFLAGWVVPAMIALAVLGLVYVRFMIDLPPRLRRLGLPAQSRIPETGRGRYRGDFRDYYDEETRELIADRYREEIQRFGYTFWLDSDEGGSVS